MKTCTLQAEDAGSPSVRLQIPTNVDLKAAGVSSNLTAGRVWPASVVLARFLMFHADRLRGSWLFEFGAGIAVPSMAALCSGSVDGVYLQELDSPALLQMQRFVFEANGLLPRLVQCPFLWGSLPNLQPVFSEHGKIGLFVAADCLYSRDDFESLARSMAHVMRTAPNAPLVMVYQDRNLLYSIDEIFEAVGLKYAMIPLASFGMSHSQQLISGIESVIDDFPEPEEMDNVLVVLEICFFENAFIFTT